MKKTTYKFKKTYYKYMAKKYAYMNACELIELGYGKEYWNACGLKGEDADNIWQQAKANTIYGAMRLKHGKK